MGVPDGEGELCLSIHHLFERSSSVFYMALWYTNFEY